MSILDDTIWSVCSDFGSHLANSCKEEFDVLESLMHKQNLEKVFCNDFICCGQYWTDLHRLLQHCEESHSEDDSPILQASETSAYYEDLEYMQISSVFEGSCINIDGMEWEMEREEDEDEDEIQTPISPALPIFSTPFLPRHITNSDLNALENGRTSPSLAIMRPSETQKEYGYEKIKEWMRQSQSMPMLDRVDDAHRPYRCQVPECGKAYKNANGLKYHKAHGHCQGKVTENLEEIAQKPYMCSLGACRKRYKNLNGLKYHIQHGHFKSRRLSNPTPVSPTQSPSPPLSPSLYSIL